MFYWDPMLMSGAVLGSMALLVSGAAVALTSLAFLQQSYDADLAVEREKLTAYLTYDQSLRQTLGLPKKASSTTPSAVPPTLLQGLEE